MRAGHRAARDDARAGTRSHRALAQNPAAAAGARDRRRRRRASCGSPSPSCASGGAPAQTARTRDDAALAKRARRRLRHRPADAPSRASSGPLRVAARPRVAILCSDVVGDGLAGPAIRALESARVLSETLRRADRRARRDGLDRRAVPGAAPLASRRARPPGRLRRDRAPGPGERVVSRRSSPRTCRSRSTSTTR